MFVFFLFGLRLTRQNAEPKEENIFRGSCIRLTPVLLGKVQACGCSVWLCLLRAGPVDTAVCQGPSLLEYRDVQCLETCFMGTRGPGVTANKCLRSQVDLLNGPFKSLSMHLELGNYLVYSANVLLAKSVLPAEQVSLSNKKRPACFAEGNGDRDVSVLP